MAEIVLAFWSMTDAYLFGDGYQRIGWIPDKLIEHALRNAIGRRLVDEQVSAAGVRVGVVGDDLDAGCLRLLQDEWWPVGYMAAEVMATLDEKAPLAQLLALLPHPLPQARWAALHALALLGEQMPLSQRIPIEPVLTALEAEDVQTRRGAAGVPAGP